MKKKPNPIPLFITAIFFVAGVVLTVLKIFFGYPYMIEAFQMFGLSVIMSYVSMLNIKFDATIELLTNVVKDINKNMENINPLSNIPRMSMKNIEIKRDLDGKISTTASSEELNFLKENGPSFIKEMLGSIIGMGEQPIEKMSDKKLSEELQKAIDKENFEKANAIKKEQEKRTKL